MSQMSRLDITIRGLDSLRRNFGQSQKILDKELKAAVWESARVIRADAKDRASRIQVGPRLSNSVQMRSLEGGLTAIVGSVAATALSIEEGRAVGDVPRVGLILAWMNRRGIVGREAAEAGAVQSVKANATGQHRVMKRGGQAVARAQLHLAWKIAIAIGVRGTKALPFIIPAVESRKKEVQGIVNVAIGRALRRLVVVVD